MQRSTVQGGMVVAKYMIFRKNVWQKATAPVAAGSVPVFGPPIEIKMDRLRKLEDAISRENEEDITNLEEYFTKLLKEKQNQ